MQRAIAFLDEPLDDVESKPGALTRPLVVKYGWKIFGSTSGGMPGPVSVTENFTSGAVLSMPSMFSSRSFGLSLIFRRSSGA